MICIPLFKGKNVQNGKLVLSFESYIPESVSDELPRSQITKKCLLTPYVGTIGNIAVFDGSFKAHLGSNVGKIELLNSDTQTFILEEYVLWYLKSTYGYAELTKYKKATAQESISIPVLADNTNQVGERFLIYTNRIDKVDTAVDDSDLIAGCNIQSTHLLYNSVAL